MADKIKLGFAFLLLVAGVAGYYLLSSEPTVIRVVSVLLGIGAAIAMAWFTAPGKQFFAFSQDSWAEARKVAWPTRKETLQTTGIVLLFVIAMALFLWAVDATLLWIVKLLLGRED